MIFWLLNFNYFLLQHNVFEILKIRKWKNGEALKKCHSSCKRKLSKLVIKISL